MTDPVRPLRLVLVPALLTLAVTLLRLTGELAGWRAPWFSTGPGGGAALVGIVWLVPVFGAWFGFRLARAGQAPPAGRALLLHLLAIAVYVGGFQVVVRVLRIDTATREGLLAQLLCMGAVSVLAAAVAWAAWPALFRVELLYGLLARLPVAAITYLAVRGAWGTHFEKYGTKDFQGFGWVEHASWLAYAQLVFWTSATAVIGGLFGSLAALPGRARAPRAAAVAAPRQMAP